MNRKRLFILCLILGSAGSLTFNDVVESAVNVADELWEEDTLNISQLYERDSDQKNARLPGDPIPIDVLDLKNMEILDVLKLISQKSGLNIVASQNVKGRVTLYLRDIETFEALTIIVDAYGWAYAKEGNIIQVMTAKEHETRYGHKFGEEQHKTLVRKLVYTKVEDLVTILKQVKSESGKIIPDPKSNTIILMDSSIKLEEMENIIKKTDVPVDTEVFTLEYSKADVVAGQIQDVLTPAVGTMKFDERSNKIYVSDIPAKIIEIENIIDAFDRKDREVLIESKIMQITLNEEHKLGVDWEAVVSDFHSLNLKSNFDVLTSTEKRGQLSIGTVDVDQYSVLVQALESVGHTNILSSPRIAAVNNKEAKILVGSTEPYVTTTTTTPSSGPTTIAESVNFIEVGVKLYVTPTIHEDDFITMKIKPEVSSVTSNLTTSNNNTIPVVETSEAETTVIVKDRVTIVIGGLIKEDTIKTTKKVPFLGNIPVLGMVFRSKDDSTRKTEIVIFLTPKIITGDVNDTDQLVAF